MSEAFNPSAQRLIDSAIPTEILEEDAICLLKALAHDEVHRYPPYGEELFKCLELDLVLYWMLQFAQPCGGDAGHRYTAASICACQGDRVVEDVDTMKQLQELGVLWFTHILLFCKYSLHLNYELSLPSNSQSEQFQ